ncbi:glycosyltransferase family 4 protein [Acidimicrobiia bacterium]|nr:glycosyltransferase family 4 protein [Acidimicrobiia bacterium]
MKVYLSKINESWVVDRMREEWYLNNAEVSVEDPKKADLVWIISPWLWKKESRKILKSKTVICSIFHLEDKDFSDKYLKEFSRREKYVDYYHVISLKTKKDLENITDKKIVYIPFWVNGNIWFDIEDKETLRDKYSIPKKTFVVGSFQRDTEGSDLISPKLIKGPDRFIKIVDQMNSEIDNLTVLLTGKRRQYVIAELEKLKINYVYLEMVDFKTLNELYNSLDLYIVTSRIEGGPQAIVECGITRTPIISTDVGIASEILHKNSIFNMNNYMNAKPDTDFAFKNSVKLNIPQGFNEYLEVFNSLVLK